MRSIQKPVIFFLILAMTISCIGYMSVDVKAGPYISDSVVVRRTLDRYGSKDTHVGINVMDLKKGQKITDVKVSPKGFLKDVNSEVYTTDKYTYGYIYGKARKLGSCSVSYKIGSTTYKTKVTVKKYVNPVRSISITGLKYKNKSNLASLTNNMVDTRKIGVLKTIKKPRLKVTAKDGWDVIFIRYQDNYKYYGSQKPTEQKEIRYPIPRPKVDIPIFTKSKAIKKDSNGYAVRVVFLNRNEGTDGSTIALTYYIGLDYRDMSGGNYMIDPK